ncbi:Intermembrane transporter PqiABC subunit PqiB (PqiB) (PDB:5UVN) (PUBMED:27795327 [Commensalibacter communis]|uniref:Intermembrane transporter PqiABC subunit PqiB (PqiB) n=1 Tax=Commensalibacter communis TaxID=2972786 RepID=A0A9W4TLD5_9PROT|nr:MlaD family protein [Commensalibacter communis]CAI3922102.1 Intermembrane transporter PqiABC subunit PqiB (PqiB) (PDB:5UVN) (PUBMED:27795327 [Commensalibacter communis]CAI3922234.1 Intermembrane transporter PqiABC subunit PqiB (PqiB) (PDB:5UVN) (PUBMED:27795327 [Commensalibacter communis]CAI3922286.1 Intermembrane transporter PqiABC subunit PqiB (PqiB) (PDB:5UVN) (PUBMED:27795327 [Commensalibacter communis]CAI3922379.1 Intermembrane transporter PqiABC subunit PqiB (PqiB) (PDB:5UVN) (PUBMED:2
MSNNNNDQLPLAPTRKIKFSLVWVVPILVAVLAIYLGWKAIYNAGPTITISFETADGIVSGQTQVKNKSVVLGTVKSVNLSKDMRHVDVQVAMTRRAASVISSNARFWVVRPRFNGANISGLETLISGAYIAFDPGDYQVGKRQRYFVGLESPPGVRSGQPGTTYTLATNNLGSLGEGAPIFYRDTVAGEVLSYDMPKGGVGPILLHIFLKKPYDSYLHPDSAFWNVSGIKFGFGATGLNIELQSIQALMSGGVAFDELDRPLVADKEHQNKETVPANTQFNLYADKDAAENARYQDNVHLVTYVTSSVKGLSKGSRVTLFGLQIGTVQNVALIIDRAANKTRAKITMDIQPDRVFSFQKKYDSATLALITKSLIANGMKASVASDNFLFGSSLISLNFIDMKKPIIPQKEGDALVIPSQAGGMDGIMASMSTVASKLAAMPLDQLGENLNNLMAHADDRLNSPDVTKTLKAMRQTMQNMSDLSKKVNNGASPLLKELPEMSRQLDQTLKNANKLLGSYGGNTDFHRNLQTMIVQLSETARSLKFFSDFMTQHPSAFITGRK